MIDTRRGVRLRTLIAIPVALAFVVAACGSDDDGNATDDGSSPATETTSAPAANDATSAPAANDATSAPAVSDTTDGGSSGGGDRVEIRWFVGLGTGAEAEQIERQDAVVEAFNESQDTITLVPEYIDNDVAKDTLATQIAGGNAPDIIGPVGLEGSNSFAGQYLDLEPLIESTGFDLSPYAAEEIEVWRDDEGTLTGLPFASYPSALYYNKELFDEAGLPYPPSEYGPDGISIYGEGTEFEGEWTWDKLTEIALILSVDANGNDATSPDYDKDAIEQWGYVHQGNTAPASQGTYWGAGRIEQEDGTAKVPEAWVAEWKWYNDLVNNKGAAPTYAYQVGDVLGDNEFNSGRVAMASTHLWYTCCLADESGEPRTWWDLAALPNYNGTVTSKLHGDNFRIMKDTDHPDEAFEVLSYFFDEAALDLLTVYGAMPARNDIRDSYFAQLDERFTQGVNWDVIIAGLEFPDVPNHQANMTKFLESDTRIKELQRPLISDPNLDIDAEVAKLEADLEQIWAG